MTTPDNKALLIRSNIMIVLLVLIAAGVGYMAFLKKAPAEVKKETAKTQTNAPLTSDNKTGTEETSTTTPSIPTGETTYMEFEKTVHDFGSTEVGKENKFIFKFKNTGDHPLVITSVKGSCSCTVPEKPEKPVQPGETGELPVVFTAKQVQAGEDVSQFVTITANTTPAETKIKVKAKVKAL